MTRYLQNASEGSGKSESKNEKLYFEYGRCFNTFKEIQINIILYNFTSRRGK